VTDKLYDNSVIVIRHRKCMLVPLNKCMAISFDDRKRKPVQYKMRDYMICNWDMDMCERLANAGIQVKCPAYFEYHWPSKYPKPFDHQPHTFNFIVLNKRNFVFNGIGTAKTLTALWAADYLMSKGLIKRVLITSTLSTLDRVWFEEIFSNMPYRTASVIHGAASRRKKLLSDLSKEFYIINHEGLKTESERLIEMSFDMVIVDEGARFRNHKTGLWQALNAIANKDVMKRLVWMTGSPMPKAPTDAWAQAKIVNPETVPKYFSRFRDQTMYKINMFKYVPMKGWEDIVYSSLKPSIRFQRDECVDLPPAMTVDHCVEMSKEQITAYEGLKKNFIAELQQGIITAVNEGAKLIKLLQLACGAIYHDNGTISKLNCKPKTDELSIIIEESGNKLIIFAPFKNTIPVITEHIQKNHSDITYGVINGDVPKAQRDVIFGDFQDGDLNIIVAHPAAMAHGLTLTATNVITWWGPVDDFEIYEQANGRISRPGQERKQYIKHLYCSDIERAVYNRLDKKEKMQGLLLDMIKK